MRRVFMGVCVVAVILTTLAASPLRAQEIDCDNLDFTTVDTLLSEARVRAAAGDKEGTLLVVAEMQAELTKIEDQCTTPPVIDVELTETYESKSFSMMYPAGLELVDDNGMFGGGSDYESVTLASDPNITTQMQQNEPIAPDSRLIGVGIGTPERTIRAIGAFSSEDDYRDVSVLELLQLAVKNAYNTAIFFSEVAELTLNDKPAAGVFFSAKRNATTTIADAYLLIIELDEDTFGLIVGVAEAGKGEQVQPLVHAVAESITLN